MNKLKIAHHFKTVLLAEDFILTGSFALNQLGFDIKAKDLDIVLVNPKGSTLEVLEELEKANPPKNLISYTLPLNIKQTFRFMYDGIGVDVFIHKNLIVSTTQTKCGLTIAPISHIVKAKKDLNRPKDMIQLINLSKTIISDEEFNSYVKTIFR